MKKWGQCMTFFYDSLLQWSHSPHYHFKPFTARLDHYSFACQTSIFCYASSSVNHTTTKKKKHGVLPLCLPCSFFQWPRLLSQEEKRKKNLIVAVGPGRGGGGEIPPNTHDSEFSISYQAMKESLSQSLCQKVVLLSHYGQRLWRYDRCTYIHMYIYFM